MGSRPSGSGPVPTTVGTVVQLASPTTISANLQQRLARVSQQFGSVSGGVVIKDEDDDEEEEELAGNHSGGTIKSYSKRKLSTDDKINDVDLDDDGLSESKTTVTIQLDPHQQNNPQLFQSSYVDVQDEVTDLRDEDIIEAVPGTTVVMTSAGHPTVHSRTTTSNVDVVAAAVNEAIKDIEYEAAAASAESAATVNDRNNVRVEAQPVDTHSNMSPETLTAISGSSSPQPPTSSATATDHDQKNMMQNLFQDGKH